MMIPFISQAINLQTNFFYLTVLFILKAVCFTVYNYLYMNYYNFSLNSIKIMLVTNLEVY